MERTLTNTTQSKKNAATPVKGNLFFQPKLTINQPDDVYEQQADTVADQVMKMPHPFVQAKPMTITPVQRTCAACENEEKKIQLKEKKGAEKEGDAALESYVSGLSASGSPLPNEVKNFYQPRFGYDFNNVKIHTDSIAAKSAQSINALAYTSGNNIVFNSGQFSPDTDSGKRLLGHELTHVVQQKEANAKSSIQRWNFDNAPIGDPMRDPRLRDHRPHGVDHGTDESVMDAVIIGAVMGEFNEDPSLAQIALDTGISLIPGVDQVADARDITAHLYFMIFRGEIISPMRWLLFCLSLIGLIPEFGSAIKGAGRVVVNGATAVLARLADILEPFRRFIPDILDYRRMVDFINSNWSNIVLFVRDSYRTITANLHALTTSFWLRITSVADNIVRQIDELYTGGSALIDDALVRLNSLFMEIREAVMNPHALTDSGMSMPIPERGATHMEMSSLEDEILGIGHMSITDSRGARLSSDVELPEPDIIRRVTDGGGIERMLVRRTGNPHTDMAMVLAGHIFDLTDYALNVSRRLEINPDYIPRMIRTSGGRLVENTAGVTNRQLMSWGRAPFLTNGGPIELHHIDQNFFELEEMDSLIHSRSLDDVSIHPRSDDPAYASWRGEYAWFEGNMRELGEIYDLLRQRYWRSRF